MTDRQHRGSGVMSSGPTVNVAARRREVSSRSKSPQNIIEDREALAEKLSSLGRRCRESEKELTVTKARLQRAEADGVKKDKTIDELLDANAGGYTDGQSIRRTQQGLITTLKARTAELEGVVMEKEVALQQLVNTPNAHRCDELERERRIFYMEVRRLQKLTGAHAGPELGVRSVAESGGGSRTEAEWKSLKVESAKLKVAKAELTQQLEWALADKDDAIARATSLESELAASRTTIRESRLSLARLQVSRGEE
jgi:hypothetical protein